jgi:hypothetical protein
MKVVQRIPCGINILEKDSMVWNNNEEVGAI